MRKMRLMRLTKRELTRGGAGAERSGVSVPSKLRSHLLFTAQSFWPEGSCAQIASVLRQGHANRQMLAVGCGEDRGRGRVRAHKLAAPASGWQWWGGGGGPPSLVLSQGKPQVENFM